MKISKLFSRKAQRGQGMTEYLIMVGVLALGSITVFGMFGSSIDSQLEAASARLSGDTPAAVAGKTSTSSYSMNLEDVTDYTDD